MTEKTTPELPVTLAAYEWPGVPGRNELALEEYSGNMVVAISRFEPCDEHEDADDHDRPGGLCFVRGYNVPVDPAELMRNLAAFVPEVEPVEVRDGDGAGEVWTKRESGRWQASGSRSVHPTAGYATWQEVIAEHDGFALYAHPPVTAEPAREALDVIATTLGKEVCTEPPDESDFELARSIMVALAAAGWAVKPVDAATAPSVTDASVDNSDATVRFDLVEGMNVEEWAHKADVEHQAFRNLSAVLDAAREALKQHGFTSDTLESQTLAESIHALAGRDQMAEWEKQLLRDAEVQDLRAEVERYKAIVAAQDEQIQLERNASVRIENLHLAKNAERQARQRANEHWQELRAARAAVEAETTTTTEGD